MSRPTLKSLHPVTWLLLLTLAVALLSWIADVYAWSLMRPDIGDELRMQSLLSAEGLRWMLRRTIPNFVTFPPLGMVLVLAFGGGVACHSGFFEACLRPFRRVHKPLSHKERRALRAALAAGVLWLLLLGVATCSTYGILRGADGGLLHSPFRDGLPLLLAVGIACMGMTFGFMSGRYRSEGDVVTGFMSAARFIAIYLFITFFASQLLSCMEYARIDLFITLLLGEPIYSLLRFSLYLLPLFWACYRTLK